MESVPLNPVRSRSKLSCCIPQQENDGLRVILFCFGILCLCVTIALIISIYMGEPEVLPRGAVATDSRICSQAGVDILKSGGNAVDAAIAGTLCMCVVHPHISSVGGGGVMMIQNYMTMKSPLVINFQERAAAFSKVLQESETVGAQTVGIPGLLLGLWESHKRFGKSKWSDLVQPAIRLCENGFPVSFQLSDALHKLSSTESPLKLDETFFPHGLPLPEDFILKQPDLALLFKSIAEHGVDEFYNGKLGEKLVHLMNRKGQNWTMSDLQNYTVSFEEAVASAFDNMTVYTSNAPTSGPQLLSMLNILDGLRTSTQAIANVTFFHELAEVMRWTQVQVAQLGDPTTDASVNQTVTNMLNRTLADKVRSQIRGDFPLPEDQLVPQVPPPQATVISVMDNDDMYVSVVSGLNSEFGAQMLTTDGYLLNNAMSNFFTNVSLPNHMRAGQRPLQYALPVMVVEKNNRCGLRIASGSSDATLLGQVLYNLIRRNQSVLLSSRMARIQTKAQNLDMEIENTQENSFPGDFISSLISFNRSHPIKIRSSPFPPINIVSKTADTLVTESDNRGGGFAVKYGP